MYRLLKILLFRLDPERAHHLTMGWLTALIRIPGMAFLLRLLYAPAAQGMEKKIGGMTFRHPVGLAAGFDKDARYLRAMALLGFSHVEVGTVTPRPQTGNPKPRLFRLVRSRALINRMGFNNAGVEAMALRLKRPRPAGLRVGANIGKNKDTPNEQAVQDYLVCFQKLYALVDYFTVNVSSPNTPGLRALQDKEPLTRLLTTLQEHNPGRKPVFLKIAPDLSVAQLDDIVQIVMDTGITGVIATNTTIAREGLLEPARQIESIGAGGLSGEPLLKKSMEVVQYLSRKSHGRFVIIGAGGIHDAESARGHLSAGADLLQLYTGLIYTGPSVVQEIIRGISRT